MKKLSKNFKSGFTLIELLVVVAIIGILASVVLASLNSARSKGSDAAIKANMANIRAQAELYYDGAGLGRYSIAAITTATCVGAIGMFADSVIVTAYTQTNVQSGGANSTCSTDATGQRWGMTSTLKGGGTWCVDNSGWAKLLVGTLTAGVCS